jgi:hypothetical protein
LTDFKELVGSAAILRHVKFDNMEEEEEEGKV